MIRKPTFMLAFVLAAAASLSGSGSAAQPVTVDLPADGPSLGRKDAPVTLVEFSGYDCFYCRRHAAQIQPPIVQAYVETGKVRYVVREFPPKDTESLGFRAAEAALCAADQGRYWEMRQKLFDKQKVLSLALLSAIAADLDLDMLRFERCLSERQYAELLQRSYSDAKASGVDSVPAIYLGMTGSAGQRGIRPLKTFTGSNVFSVYASAIEALLAGANRQIGTGSQETAP